MTVSDKNLDQKYNAEARLSILEHIYGSHDKRINDIEKLHRDFIDKHEKHMVIENNNHIKVEKSLSEISISLKMMTDKIGDLNDNIDLVSDEADAANTGIIKHETVAQTILKVIFYGSILTAGFWELFTYIHK